MSNFLENILIIYGLFFFPTTLWLIRQFFVFLRKRLDDTAHKKYNLQVTSNETRKIKENRFIYWYSFLFGILGIGILKSRFLRLIDVYSLRSQEIIDTFKLLFSKKYIDVGVNSINFISTTEYEQFFSYLVFFFFCAVILIHICLLFVLHKDLKKPYKRFYFLLLTTCFIWNFTLYWYDGTLEKGFENLVAHHNARLTNQSADSIYDITVDGDDYAKYTLYVFDKEENSIIYRNLDEHEDISIEPITRTNFQLNYKGHERIQSGGGFAIVDFDWHDYYTFTIFDKKQPIYFYSMSIS